MTKSDTAATTRRRASRAARARAARARTPAASARTSSTRPAARASRVQALAGRAILIPLGAALEARDRVVGTVDGVVATTRSRAELGQRLERLERRGDSARAQLEREVRRTRTRLEQRSRRTRREIERGIQRRRAQASRSFGGGVEVLARRVENVVQNGVDAGMKLVSGAQDRLSKVV